MRPLKCAILLTCCTLAIAPAAVSAATPMFSATGADETLFNPPFTIGYSFTLSDTFTASALGLFDGAAAGFLARHEIGLWNSSGTLLASTIMGAGLSGTLIDNFRYNSIAPLALNAGTYRIGALFTGTDDRLIFTGFGTATPISGVTLGNGMFAAGSALADPTSDAGAGGGYYGPNVLLDRATAAVPEPATWLTMILGFGLVGAAMRRKQRQTVRLHFA